MLLRNVIIDWPSCPLWPNSRDHFAKVATSRGMQKEAAFYLGKGAGWYGPFKVHNVHLTMTFCAPTKRRFDLDNALAACKGAIDGLSDCLGVDDSLFSYTLRRGDKTPGGAVIIGAEVV